MTMTSYEILYKGIAIPSYEGIPIPSNKVHKGDTLMTTILWEYPNTINL